jgi:hypothetical protein
VRPWQLPSWRRFGSSFLAPVVKSRQPGPVLLGWRHLGRISRRFKHVSALQ